MDPDKYNFWKREGAELGLSGEKLYAFIKGQIDGAEEAEKRRQEEKRLERLAEREAEKEKREAEKEKREFEAAEREAEKEKREAEKEKREFEAAERAAERAVEKERSESQRALEERRIALEERRLDLMNRGTPVQSDNDPPVKMPKMPPYSEGEDITAYIIRFERMAELCRWPEDSLATRLGLLFTGNAVKVYSSLPDNVHKDYKLLKKAILQAYRKTSDNYRKEFRYAKIQAHSTYNQFLTSLYSFFDYWVESAAIEKTFESLRDFMVADQFLTLLPAPVRIFLKEHNTMDGKKLAELADLYAGAHKAYPDDRKGKVNILKVPNDKVTVPTANIQIPVRNITNNAICFKCGQLGHKKNHCPSIVKVEHKIGKCFDDSGASEFPMSYGTINGAQVSSILRDSGCSCVVVSEDVLPNLNPVNYPKKELSDYLGRKDSFPCVKCYLKCDWYDGWVEAVVAPLKFCSVLLGNIPGAKLPKDVDFVPLPKQKSKATPAQDSKENTSSGTDNTMVNVVTRRKKGKNIHPLILPQIKPLKLTADEFKSLQSTCPSLSHVREKTINGETIVTKNRTYQYSCENGIIFRKIVDSILPHEVDSKSLVVPTECRTTILSLAHDIPVSGHFSHRKTALKVKEHFYWPGMDVDIRNFCRSCDICQRCSPKGKVKPAPLVKMPIITTPFERVAIDLVGPITPCSSEGHKYILTLVDFATSFPEAVPLKNISSIDVAEALVSIFSRVGVPKEILSDRGTQFTSEMMERLCELVGIKPLFTTPYHPMGNGRIERQHSVLKSILRKLCNLRPQDWHRYIPCALFAMREIPSDSLGFSPFELLYGRQARGPLTILNDLWVKTDLPNETKTTYQFVLDLRTRLEETAEIAAQNLKMSMERYKTYFDRKSSQRKLIEGDEVLLLLPEDSNKLKMTWKGPYKVVKSQGNVNYVICINGKDKLFHINMLKKYHRRTTDGKVSFANEVDLNIAHNLFFDSSIVSCCIVSETDLEVANDDKHDKLIAFDLAPEKGDVSVNPELTSSQKKDVVLLMNRFTDVFSVIPGQTETIEHAINISSSEPLRKRVYPVPVHLREEFNKEIDNLLRLDIIEPSNSPYCSPVVMVKKPDGSYRVAQDFRGINSITHFDAEPMPNLEDELYKFSDAKYFTEIDITKAYHQIPLRKEDRHLTAFPTPYGLMQYKRMPFGLVTACATYNRLMHKIFDGMDNVTFYFDNIFVYNTNWTDHLSTLGKVLTKLRNHHLTANPSKCHIAFPKINYLGFTLGDNKISPQDCKIQSFVSISCPTTKKQLRSFLGMANFYRRFVPNFACISSSLTDLLKKSTAEPLQFTSKNQEDFDKLKACLSSPPILKLPDKSKTFCLRTDASSLGLGAALFQYHDDLPMPVAYASKKLSDTERKYSTIEREAYAIIFGVSKFRYYLLGKEFILETDHKPLIYLESFKCKNERVARWTLLLQQYKFHIVYIPGADNHGADVLSRL